MRIYQIDVLNGHAGISNRLTDTFSLTLGIGENVIGGGGVNMITGNFAVDFGAASLGILESFDGINAAALRYHDAVAGFVKGPTGFLGVLMGSQGILTFEARENAVPFYKSLGYQIEQESYLLFGEIQHYRMKKALPLSE